MRKRCISAKTCNSKQSSRRFSGRLNPSCQTSPGGPRAVLASTVRSSPALSIVGITAAVRFFNRTGVLCLYRKAIRVLIRCERFTTCLVCLLLSFVEHVGQEPLLSRSLLKLSSGKHSSRPEISSTDPGREFTDSHAYHTRISKTRRPLLRYARP